LESQNVYSTLSQRSADFAESAWLIVHVNRKLFCLGHLRPPYGWRFRGTQDAFLRNHKTFGFELYEWGIIWPGHLRFKPSEKEKTGRSVTLAEQQRGYKLPLVLQGSILPRESATAAAF
jgi:hypothetical protein